MKKLLLWLWLLTKRQLRNKAMLIIIIGMPVAAMIITNIPAMTQLKPIKVALCAEDNDEVSSKTIEKLVAGTYSVQFYTVDNEKDLTLEVLNRQADYGYIFTSDMTEKLDDKEVEGSIILVTENTGISTSITNEVVFAALYRIYGSNIITDYISKNKMFANVTDKAIDIAKNNYNGYADGNQTFYVDFKTISEDSSLVELEDLSTIFPVRGLMAVAVYMAGLFGVLWWKLDNEKGVFVSYSYGFRITSRLLYSVIPAILLAVSAEMVFIITRTAAYPQELLKMFLYILSISAFSFVLNIIIPDSSKMIMIILVLLLLSLVVCPVFININAVVPAFRYIARLLLPYYYI